MKRKVALRSLLGVIVLGTLGVVAIMVWRALAPGPGNRVPPPKPDVAADLKLDRVHYTETREGVKEWELEAASAVYFKEENTVVLDKVRATFFGKDQESYLLIGEKGRFNTQTKVIEVYGGVRVDSSSGYQVHTKSLKYRSDKKELSTSDPVKMKGPDLQVEGVGMVVELNRDRLKILGGVTTTLFPLSTKKSSPSTL